MTALRLNPPAPGRADSVLLNVAILPPPAVSSPIIALSRELAGHGGLFTLDGVDRMAHMTVYMARFPAAAVPALVARLTALTANMARVHLEQCGYFATAGNYYEVSYTLTDDLVAVQSATSDALADLRYRPGDPVVEPYFEPYTPAQRANAEATGYDLAAALYRPHISITKFDHPPEHTPAAAGDLSFELDTLGLFIADDWGAARRQLATFDIRS